MSGWPEDLSWIERLYEGIPDLSVSDADEGDTPFTTGSIDLLEGAGMFLISLCFVVMEFAAVMGGLLFTRKMLRQRAIT